MLLGVLISSSSQPLLRSNRIFGGKAAGIEVTNNGGGYIENNEVFDNNFDGICLATGVSPVLSGTYEYLYLSTCNLKGQIDNTLHIIIHYTSLHRYSEILW